VLQKKNNNDKIKFEKFMKKILLVEDDPFLIDLYTTKLEQEGFSVEVSNDGEDCFRRIKENIPDLVLLDIVLPNVDGWEILQKIRNDEKFKDLKIVILSNLNQKEEIEKGLKFNVEKYLVKAHYTPTEVVEEVKKII
jgi:CheY-like chemotaxis protein